MPDHTDTTDDEFPGLSELLGNAAVWADPPPGLEDDIVAAIAEEAAELDSPTTTTSASAVPAPARRPRWLQAVAAVALVVVGFGAAFLFTGGDDDLGDPDDTIELAGSPLAPEASAVARIDSTPAGVRILLDVTGLEPAPSGSYYQAWMRTPDDGVSAGTFHLRGGDAEIELWSGVLVDDYPIISVTLQDEGEGPESSGVVVLKGQLAD